MNEAINRDSIIGYLNQQNPKGALEVAKAFNEVKAIMQAVIELSERLNISRQVKQLQTETSQLKTEVDSLSQAIEQTKLLNEEHYELTKRRETLRAEYEILSDLNAQKSEIEQLTALLAKHNIPALQYEIQQLRHGLKGDIDNLNVFINEVGSFLTQMKDDFIHETRELLEDVTEKREQINSVLNDTRTGLKNEQIHLSKKLQEYDKDLTEVYSQYKSVAEQINAVKTELVGIRLNHDKNVAVYELHFAQNKNIYGELGKRHNLDNHLKNLFEDIENKLSQFDHEIKTLVEKVDHINVF
jgi:chromosome segregation ATPase